MCKDKGKLGIRNEELRGRRGTEEAGRGAKGSGKKEKDRKKWMGDGLYQVMGHVRNTFVGISLT